MPLPRLKPRRLALIVAGIVLVGLFLALAWNHDRLALWNRTLLLPLGLGVALSLGLAASALVWIVRRNQQARRAEREKETEALDPEALARAVETQAARAKEFIDRIRNSERRDKLTTELERLQTPSAELHIVVFGTVSAGKTSLINALIGRQVGETGAVMGTTRHGENHTYTLTGVEGTVYLTDTPGVSEGGLGGVERENQARDLAKRADLLLFVVDHDLIRSEYAPLIELARLGKRSILVLNKKDRFPESDLAAILAKLRDRIEGVVAAEDVVAVAAAPRPIPIRTIQPDGSYETILEVQDPDVQALRDRIAKLLSREGPLLQAANLLIKTRLLSQEAETGMTDEQRRLADELIDRYQWVTAAKVFANPIPALNLVEGAAVQLDLIADLARIYGVEPTTPQLRLLAGRMVQAMIKVGMVETATSVIAGIFKRTPLTFAAAGAVQALTMAYLVRIAGKAFSEYFQHGQSWGAEGIEGVVLRQFEINSRAEFLQDFARQALDRFLKKVNLKSALFRGRGAP